MTVMGATFFRRDGSRQDIQHPGAFALMKYQNKVNGRVEWLWNSRDGATPFLIGDSQADPVECEAYVAGLKNGSIDASKTPAPDRMAATDPKESVTVPNYVPPIGTRIVMSWADTPEGYKQASRDAWAGIVEERIAAGGDPALRAAEPFEQTAASPCILTVEESLHAHFARLAAENPFVPPPSIIRSAPGLVPSGSRTRPN